MVEKSCCAPDRLPDCRSWASCWNACAMGLLLLLLLAVVDAVELFCGTNCCNVAKSDWAADRLPDCRSWPSCWNSCRIFCPLSWTFWWLKSNRLPLEIPDTDIASPLNGSDWLSSGIGTFQSEL